MFSALVIQELLGESIIKYLSSLHMAIKSTIYKAHLAIANIDLGYYADHSLTLARHPSETDERMMVRLIALALQAHQIQTVFQGDGIIAFGAGLSDAQEPDVSLRDFSDQIQCWIEVGQPEDRPIIKACGKARQVYVYAYHHAAEVWFKAIENKLTRLKNLEIHRITSVSAQGLLVFAKRSMQLQATILEGQLTISDGQESVDVQIERWK